MRKPRVTGHLDGIINGSLCGWLFDPSSPDQRVEFEVVTGRYTHGPFFAGSFRQDLLDAGIGDGRHCFAIPVPLLISDRGIESIIVRTRRRALGKRAFERTCRFVGKTPGVLIGHLDSLENQTLVGWAVDETAPNDPVILTLKVAGNVVHTAIANLPRPDLRAAGLPSERHGYVIPLEPYIRTMSDDEEILVELTGDDGIGTISPFPLRYSKRLGLLYSLFQKYYAVLEPSVARLSANPATDVARPLFDESFLHSDADPQLLNRAVRAARNLTELQSSTKFSLEHSPWLTHLKARYGGAGESKRLDEAEIDGFVHWYIQFSISSRVGLPLLIGRSLMQYLNEPVPPKLAGVPSLSRLMRQHWLSVQEQYPLDRAESVTNYLSHWVADMVEKQGIPLALTPQRVIDYLNQASPACALLEYPLSNYALYILHDNPALTNVFDIANPNDRLAYLLYFAASQSDTRLIPTFVRELLSRRVIRSEPVDAFSLILKWCERIARMGTVSARLLEFGALSHDLSSSSCLDDALPDAALAAPPCSPGHHGKLDSLGEKTRPHGIAVIGSLDAQSGLGENARLSASALRRLGLKVSTLPYSINDPSAPMATGRSLGDELPDGSPAVNLIHIQPDNLPEALLCLDPRRWRDSYNIGYFAWEFQIPPDSYRLGVEFVDEIWTPSRFVQQSFQSVTDVPVIVMGQAVESAINPICGWREKLGFSKNTFLFYYSFDFCSWLSRKNPIGVVRAFRKAFGVRAHEVGLILKVRNAELAPGMNVERQLAWEELVTECQTDSRIRLLSFAASREEMSGLMTDCDAYVSLHRAEGFGYTIAEAMLLGKPVIATAYSGNLEFTTEGSSLLVPFDLKPVMPGEYSPWQEDMVWAEPDLDKAAEHMVKIHQDQGFRNQLATAGQDFVRRNLGLLSLAERYSARLSALAPSLLLA